MALQHSKSPNPKCTRRGGTYIIVLGSALIVSTLGTMALLQQRIQRKAFEAAAKTEQARLNIESALRLGLLDIRDDPNWRDTYAANNGEALTISSSEFGNVVLKAVDPIDNILTDDENDPVVLKAMADVGQAAQLGEAMLYPTRVPPETLLKGVVAGDDVTATGATVHSDRPVSCDASTLSSANMHADVEAVTLSGTTYHEGQTLVLQKDRPALPDIDSIVSEYVSRGTPISFGNLRTPNLVRNPNMEEGEGDEGLIDHWFPSNSHESASCEVEHDDDRWWNGNYSLRVHSRTAGTAGPIQYTTAWVKSNTLYRIRARVYISNGLLGLDPQYIRFAWYVKPAGGSGQWQYGNWTNTGGLLDSGGWYSLSEEMTAGSWLGDVELSYIKIETYGGGNKDFNVDDFSVTGGFLYRRVLSPASNPFAPTKTDPEGIYVIDCNGSDLVIERCRIRGTLFLLNPGPDSAIEGPISWEPAKAGYPSLIVGSTGFSAADMKIRATRKGLIEAHEQTNFNPSGTPHDAVGTDSDQDDTLPSEIRGWMYIGGTLTLANEPTIHGVVLAGDDIHFHGKPIIYWDPSPTLHPPPGLAGTLELKPRNGGTSRVVQ